MMTRIGVVVLALVLLASLAVAQDVRFVTSPATGRVLAIKADVNALPAAASLNPVASAKAFLDKYGQAFGLGDRKTELVLKSREQDRWGRAHLRYSQEYRGLPVYAAELVLHADTRGVVTSANGSVGVKITVPVKPRLDQFKAIAIAQKLFAGNHPMVKPEVKRATLQVFQPAVFNNSDDLTAYLVFEIELMNKAFVDESYFVDANTAALRLFVDQIRRLNRRVFDCSAKFGQDGCWSDFHTTYDDPNYGWNPPPPPDFTFGCRESGGYTDCPHGANPRYLQGEQSLDTDTTFSLLADIHNY